MADGTGTISPITSTTTAEVKSTEPVTYGEQPIGENLPPLRIGTVEDIKAQQSVPTEKMKTPEETAKEQKELDKKSADDKKNKKEEVILSLEQLREEKHKRGVEPTEDEIRQVRELNESIAAELGTQARTNSTEKGK